MKVKTLRKLALMTCLVVGSLNFSSIAYAKDKLNEDTIKNAELRKKIAEKTDKEFDDFMTDYMNKKHINNRSVNEIKNELKSIGVELLDYSESTVNQAIMAGGVVTMATTTYPSDVTIQSYSAKRTGDSFYRLYTQVTHDQTLYDCGSLDLLTVEWDPDYFTLYDYSTISYSPSGDGNFISLMDDAKGVLVFTVEDKRMYSPDYVCGIAYVTKQKAGTSKFRGKYIHTYNDESINWSIGGNLNYSQKDGWNGGLTITIKPDTKTTTWEKESLNWITVK